MLAGGEAANGWSSRYVTLTVVSTTSLVTLGQGLSVQHNIDVALVRRKRDVVMVMVMGRNELQGGG